MSTLTLPITRFDDGSYKVHVESNAELLAYAICAETTVKKDHVVLAGLCGDDTDLLEQALASISLGQGEWVMEYPNGTSTVDGSEL